MTSWVVKAVEIFCISLFGGDTIEYFDIKMKTNRISNRIRFYIHFQQLNETNISKPRQFKRGKMDQNQLWTVMNQKDLCGFFFLLKVKWNKDGRALCGFSKYFSSWIPNHNVCPITAGLRMHHSLHSICILHSALCNLDYNSILCDFSASTGMV